MDESRPIERLQHGPGDARDEAFAALLEAVRVVQVAQRVHGDAERQLLQTVVDAAVTLFDAEASSIALFERDPDRLEFHVAAGEQGQSVVGLSVAPMQGVTGYVFSTGQPIALSDVATDPRFDRSVAERTGYQPRSLAAVPLVDAEGTVGVLQVLDKRDAAAFSLRDMELLAVFARQAAAAIAASRVSRDGARLIRTVLAEAAGGQLDEAHLDVLVLTLADRLDDAEADGLWGLADRIAALRGLPGADISLVADILDAVARRGGRTTRNARRG